MNWRILALSRDRGSMQAIAPVVAHLGNDPDVAVTTVAHRESWPVVAGLGLQASRLDEAAFAQDPAGCIAALLDTGRPDLVLSGSGPARGPAPESPEQFAILEARRRGIPTVAVQDYWGMYAERFSRDGRSLAADLLPDRLCVLDSRAMAELEGFGVPGGRLAITHNPWLDSLVAESAAGTPAVRPASGPIKVLLASQPLASMRAARNWPYDQFDLFETLLAAMPGRSANGRSATIQVLAHPAEDLGPWESRMPKLARDDVGIELHAARVPGMLRDADYLVTSHSTLAYEALYFGTPCLSLRPAGRTVMRAWTDDAGLSTEFRDAAGLRQYLASSDPRAERERILGLKRDLGARGLFFSDGMATRRVVEEVRRALAGRQGAHSQ